jgi:hypothetical protein
MANRHLKTNLEEIIDTLAKRKVGDFMSGLYRLSDEERRLLDELFRLFGDVFYA